MEGSFRAFRRIQTKPVSKLPKGRRVVEKAFEPKDLAVTRNDCRVRVCSMEDDGGEGQGVSGFFRIL